MKILIISSRIPFPVKTGDRVLLYNRLKRLHLNNEITLILLYSRDSELSNIDSLYKYCKNIHTFKISKIRSIFNIISNFLFDRSPLQVLYFKINSIQKKIKLIHDQGEFDIVNAYLIRTIPLIEFLDTPIVLDMIDSMQLNFERRINHTNSIILKLLYKFEYNRIVHYENNLPKNIKKSLVVASEDKAYIHSDATVLSLGVDTEYFATANNQRNNTIIFSGNMSYEPNIQAILWFYKKCYPIILKKVPNVSLIIAGTSPSKELINLRSKRIKVTGYVDSLSELISQSTLSIAPMQSGSGMQNKILEAMSCEVPVVTTKIGLGSIDIQHLGEIIVEDNSSKFADYVIDILLNPDSYNTLTKRARNFVIKHHSWDSHVSNLLIEYQNAIKK
jgi:polysaccharide biosynthesis protein PslH